jgi:subtilisin family serine protease
MTPRARQHHATDTVAQGPVAAAPRMAARRELVSPLIGRGADPDDAVRRRLVHTVGDRQAVLLELNLAYGNGAEASRSDFLRLFGATFADPPTAPPAPVPIATHYLRCLLSPDEIARLVDADGASRLADPSDLAASATARVAVHPNRGRTIYRVWPDYIVRSHLDRSVSTIKGDAAVRTYGTTGAGIVWAVIDSGVDAQHPHFAGGNLSDPAVASLHRDFTGLIAVAESPSRSGTDSDPNGDSGQSGAFTPVPDDPASALTDAFGHGTHVAGIIAGSAPPDRDQIRVAADEPTAAGLPSWVQRDVADGHSLNGVAPDTRIVSLKVLDDSGHTLSSAVIAALDYVRTVNADGRRLRIHGVNLSLGCEWVPEEYAAGQSPLCRELDLLVGSGVVAVVSAGNGGAGGTLHGASTDVFGMLSTITDPGNAEQAITVGSTHRYRPHTFGITFDSGKGPTVDGRAKPDLVAPGERITSAATGAMRAGIDVLDVDDPAKIGCYVEDRGTSMAAAHVSGAIAAFLSVRTEFIGEPQRVKELFLANATSLGRHAFFQGAGLVDLMRVLSSC